MMARWSCYTALPLRLVLGVIFVVLGLQKLLGYFGGPGLIGTAAFMASAGLTPGTFLGVGRQSRRAARRGGAHPRYLDSLDGARPRTRVAGGRGGGHGRHPHQRRVPAGRARGARLAGAARAAELCARRHGAATGVLVGHCAERTGPEGRVKVTGIRADLRRRRPLPRLAPMLATQVGTDTAQKLHRNPLTEDTAGT